MDSEPDPTDPTDPPDPTDAATHRSDGGRPLLLFYCQHSLGLGHLARSLVLASGLAERFHVVLLNGGRLPRDTAVPAGVELVNLPPLGHDETHALISHDPGFTVEAAMAVRTATILRHLARRPAVVLVELYPFGRKKFAFELTPLLDAIEAMAVRTATILRHLARRPVVVLVELYPFGRKKFAFELTPLLEAIEAMGPCAPVTVCSVRDILVGRRRNQAAHDERAALIANRCFDAIVVHADPRFATLQESFHPQTPLTVPVHYSGFVTERPPAHHCTTQRLGRVVVSAGGGMVGGPLLEVATDACAEIRRRIGLDMLVVAGPFVPDGTWQRLCTAARSIVGLDVVHHVADLHDVISRSTVSVSQCGYNTTMDILRAGTPALVVPYAEGGEDEQTRRAERLERAGVLRMLAADRCTPTAFAEAVCGLVGTTPGAVTLDLDGCAATASIIGRLAAARADRVLRA